MSTPNAAITSPSAAETTPVPERILVVGLKLKDQGRRCPDHEDGCGRQVKVDDELSFKRGFWGTLRSLPPSHRESWILVTTTTDRGLPSAPAHLEGDVQGPPVGHCCL